MSETPTREPACWDEKLARGASGELHVGRLAVEDGSPGLLVAIDVSQK
jgi:hypothetical protein